MDPAYLKAKEKLGALLDRRRNEDHKLKTKLEQEQAKLEQDKEAQIKVYDDNAQSVRRKLEEAEDKKTKALTDRHEEEMWQLKLRQQQEQQGRTKEKEDAIRDFGSRIVEANEQNLNKLVNLYKIKSEDLLAKFKKDQAALKIAREAEDAEGAKELYQTIKEQSLLMNEASSQKVRLSQRPAILPTQTDVPTAQQPARSSSLSVPQPPSHPRDASKTPRARSPPLDRSPYRYRSDRPNSRSRSRSPPRGRLDRPDGDRYRPSYHSSSDAPQRHSPPYSPLYSYMPHPSGHRDGYYEAPRRERSRSPLPHRPLAPPTGPRDWNRRSSPPPRNTMAFSNPPMNPSGSKRGRDREGSPLKTMSREIKDNLPTIPTGPRADIHKKKKARHSEQMAPPPPGTPIPQTITGAHGLPIQLRQLIVPAGSNNNTLVLPLPNKPPTPANAQEPGMEIAVPTPTKQAGGTRPIGRWMVQGPLPRDIKPVFETKFPVQRVKYTEENGELYEWEASTVKPIQAGELHLIGHNFKGVRTKGVRPNSSASGWNLREGTVARIVYSTRWGVIRVVKLKQEDVGPKELWLEFTEPKKEVLTGFLKSFKTIPWTLYKVYPEEMPDSEVNPMESALKEST